MALIGSGARLRPNASVSLSREGSRQAWRGRNLSAPSQGGEPFADQLRLMRRRSGERGRVGCRRRQGQLCCPMSGGFCSAVRWLTDGALAKRQRSCHHSMKYCDGGDVMRRPVFLFRDLLFVAGVLLFLQISVAHAASAEHRLALVVGQSAYRAVPALPNAENDGKKMAELLTNAGFDVTAAPDLSQNDMRQTISDFAAKVAGSGPDTIALVFYAGHGLQIDGENYLVPVDVDPKREADIPLQAVRLNDLLNTLGALPTRMRIIMLDACRNNPFPALNRTAGHGLAIVDTKAGAPGSFISYPTSPGSEAEDGAGADSPYTTAVLSVAKEPNLPIEEAFKRVRIAVSQSTDGRQIPWESSSLTTEFKFFSADSGQQGATAPKPPATAARSTDDWRKDLQGKEPKIAYELVSADNSGR